VDKHLVEKSLYHANGPKQGSFINLFDHDKTSMRNHIQNQKKEHPGATDSFSDFWSVLFFLKSLFGLNSPTPDASQQQNDTAAGALHSDFLMSVGFHCFARHPNKVVQRSKQGCLFRTLL
jgi:hypothetical protein